MAQKCSQDVPSAQVPHFEGLVFRGGEQLVPIFGKGNVCHSIVVSLENPSEIKRAIYSVTNFFTNKFSDNYRDTRALNGLAFPYHFLYSPRAR